MSHGFLIAQTEHGPGMHGPVLLVVVAIAVVGALVFFLARNLRRSDRNPASDRTPEANDRSRDDPDPANGGDSDA
ncbi:MAG: hypothetical protein ACR2G9_04860 [Gaiellaceae bacterium]